MLSSGGTSEPQRNFPTEDDGMAQDSHTERAVWMGERERDREREPERETESVICSNSFFGFKTNMYGFSVEKKQCRNKCKFVCDGQVS